MIIEQQVMIESIDRIAVLTRSKEESVDEVMLADEGGNLGEEETI